VLCQAVRVPLEARLQARGRLRAGGRRKRVQEDEQEGCAWLHCNLGAKGRRWPKEVPSFPSRAPFHRGLLPDSTCVVCAESANCLNKAADYFTDLGRLSIAAKHFKVCCVVHQCCTSYLC